MSLICQVVCVELVLRRNMYFFLNNGTRLFCANVKGKGKETDGKKIKKERILISGEIILDCIINKFMEYNKLSIFYFKASAKLSKTKILLI